MIQTVAIPKFPTRTLEELKSLSFEEKRVYEEECAEYLFHLANEFFPSPLTHAVLITFLCGLTLNYKGGDKVEAVRTLMEAAIAVPKIHRTD